MRSWKNDVGILDRIGKRIIGNDEKIEISYNIA